MEIFVAEFLDCTNGYANFEGSCNTGDLLWLDHASHFAHMLPIPYVQATILNLLNPRIATALRDS